MKKVAFLSIVCCFFGNLAVAEVRVSELQKGVRIETTKPSRIYQYDFQPTGGGLYEPGYSLVSMSAGHKFVVKSVYTRTHSDNVFFFDRKNTEMVVNLEIQDHFTGQPFFQIVVPVKETDKDITLDYLKSAN